MVLGIAALRVPFAAAFSFFFAGTMLQSNIAVYLKDVLQFGPIGIGSILFTVGVMISSASDFSRVRCSPASAPARSSLPRCCGTTATRHD
jgi:hypothetical protein